MKHSSQSINILNTYNFFDLITLRSNDEPRIYQYVSPINRPLSFNKFIYGTHFNTKSSFDPTRDEFTPSTNIRSFVHPINRTGIMKGGIRERIRIRTRRGLRYYPRVYIPYLTKPIIGIWLEVKKYRVPRLRTPFLPFHRACVKNHPGIDRNDLGLGRSAELVSLYPYGGSLGEWHVGRRLFSGSWVSSVDDIVTVIIGAYR